MKKARNKDRNRPPANPRGAWRLAAGNNVSHEGEDFDELVVGNWFHIEQMDDGLWWLALYTSSGDPIVMNVVVGKDSKVTRVNGQSGIHDIRWYRSEGEK